MTVLLNQTSLRFASLGSGSKGNATVIQSDNSCVMIDCGFSVRETDKRLLRLNISAQDIAAVLLTHEHSDHASGAVKFCRRYEIPLYATFGTFEKIDTGTVQCHHVRGDVDFDVEGFVIAPIVVPHDAREPVQYIVKRAGKRVGLLTDIGHITPHVREQYSKCDALIIECNHARDLLQQGPYPAMLKARVSGHWGHLSNEQARDLLRDISVSRLEHLVIAHISEKNNSLASVEHMLAEFDAELNNLVIANQADGFGWLSFS